MAAALIPVGISLGLYSVSSGFQWYWAPIFSLVIFAGSIEFLAVSFIVAGLPLSLIAWLTLAINFRHIFYGLSFPINRMTNVFQKIYGVFALIDEVYGITAAGEGRSLDARGIILLQILCQVYWVAGTLLGSVVGTFIPESIRGFDFAVTAMFLVMAVDAIQANKEINFLVLAILSSAIGLVFEIYIIKNSFLLVGLGVYVGLISLNYIQNKRSV